MTKRFKVGDKVRRTGVNFQGVNKGQTYTVRSVSPGCLGLVEDQRYDGYDSNRFELVASLEDVLRDQYPIVYDELVSTGQFDLAPREDVFEVTFRVPVSNRETEESMQDWLQGHVDEINELGGDTVTFTVQKVSD